MNTLFIFSLFSSVTLAMLLVTWRVTMKRCNLPSLNRRLLLAIYGAALLLPLPAMLFDFRAKTVSPGFIEIGDPTVIFDTVAQASTSSSLFPVLIHIFIIISLLTACYFASGLVRIMIIRARSHHLILSNGTRVNQVSSGLSSPFSFLGEIYVPASVTDAGRGEMMLLHEEAHVSHRHWIDLIVAQVVCILQWYNPGAWMMLAEIKRLHEYEADAAVLGSGIDRRAYQMLLLDAALSPSFLSITDNFNQNSLKSRFIMMYNSPSSPRRALRSLALLPVAASALCIMLLPPVKAFAGEIERASSQPESSVQASTEKSIKIISAGDDVHEAAEVMPEFPGGYMALFKYLINNIVYPEKAMRDNIEGRVVVKFIIDENGKVTDPSIVKSVSPELDQEALRVVGTLPDFTPGMTDGKKVKVYYNLPVSFKLSPSAPQTVKPDGLKNATVFVDGKAYDGSIQDLSSDRIESIDVIKDDPAYPDGKIMISLKK